MKYRIIAADNGSVLESQIDKLLKEGWKLQGGVAVKDRKPLFGIGTER